MWTAWLRLSHVGCYKLVSILQYSGYFMQDTLTRQYLRTRKRVKLIFSFPLLPHCLTVFSPIVPAACNGRSQLVIKSLSYYCDKPCIWSNRTSRRQTFALVSINFRSIWTTAPQTRVTLYHVSEHRSCRRMSRRMEATSAIKLPYLLRR
jgi:hypothetical protein